MEHETRRWKDAKTWEGALELRHFESPWAPDFCPKTDIERNRMVGRKNTGRKAGLKNGTWRRNFGPGSGAGMPRRRARHERRGTARGNESRIVTTRRSVRGGLATRGATVA